MNKNSSRILAFTFSACIALCSCSETKKNSHDSEKQSLKENNSATQSLTELSENSYKLVKYKTIDKAAYLYDITRAKDGFYYASGDDTSHTNADSAASAPYIYKISSDFSDFQKIELELPEAAKQADEINNFIVYNANGDIAVFYTFIDNGDMEEPEEYDENFDYEAFYENQTASYGICFYNNDGTIRKFIDLGSMESENSEDDSLIYHLAIAMPDSDTVVTFYSHNKIDIFKSDANHETITVPDEFLQYCDPQLLTGSDGKSYLSIVSAGKDPSSTQNKILEIDTDTNELKDPFYTENSANYIPTGPYHYITGCGDYLFIGSNEDEVMGIKADGTSETILKWVDADTTEMRIIPADNDEFYCLSYNNYGNEPSLELYKLVHRQAGELDNVQIITMASFGSNPLNSYISKFNREQDKYRIQSVDYSTELTPEDMEDKSPQSIAERNKNDFNKLEIDITAGKCPDILMLSRSDTALLGKKGALLDLYTLMDNDSEVNRDTVAPNILKALESREGKLYSITPSFTVNTFAAKKKFVDHENWTLQEMIDLYDRMDTASKRYSTMDKSEVFCMMLYADSDLVDIERSECHFDTPEFIEKLKFCNRFVDEMEFADKSGDDAYQRYWEEYSRRFTDDQDIISNVMLCGDRDLGYEQIEFGEDITLVGFPTSNGKGGKLEPSYEFSIGAGSSVKEGAWEFIKMILSDASDENIDAGKGNISDGYPVLMKDLDNKIDSMSKVKAYDENGNLIESTTYTIQGIPINTPTKEELADLKRYILSCDTLKYSMDDDAYAICIEEAEEYFHGGKSAEEAAKMMQNRISLIVSEKS
ncbi:ABC-type glycerol-3-phosphate transport system, substrate-binding protein [Ruminococcus flavefaciens]|uniref:ABC-type glycerol-3-phosphate transport system, substrate-binding protein n=1 Tax=Ruminococcus flavefaciens TaxID=1265 RepID=A0A1H6KVR9_RUMFL|nr:hypothetical protein [Ruminococcus flavefaciens]SEH76056.1 ABC-type glycerol-3-phosphate transport system, substrate-binding protein [Ruminococcus flavefaciens]